MARRRCIALLMVLALVAAWAGTVVASPARQTFSYGVPLMVMSVGVQPDGSATIVYDITFENYGSPIDVIDVGTPNEDYDISRMEASIDGAPLSDIRRSEYIDVGVEVHLDSHADPIRWDRRVAPGVLGSRLGVWRYH